MALSKMKPVNPFSTLLKQQNNHIVQYWYGRKHIQENETRAPSQSYILNKKLLPEKQFE